MHKEHKEEVQNGSGLGRGGLGRRAGSELCVVRHTPSGGLSGAKRQKRHFSVKTIPLGLEVGRATRSVHRAACMAAGGAGRGLRAGPMI